MLKTGLLREGKSSETKPKFQELFILSSTPSLYFGGAKTDYFSLFAVRSDYF